TQSVELSVDASTARASGRLSVRMDGAGERSDRIVVQTAQRNQSGQVIFSKPETFVASTKPGRIYSTATPLRQIIKTSRRESCALLEPFIDPDQDCKLTRDEKDLSLLFELPAEKTHILSVELLTRDRSKPLHNAPMSLAAVAGDFAAIVEVSGEFSPSLTVP